MTLSSKVDNLDKHVNLLKNQIAMLSLNIAALQSQVKAMETQMTATKLKTTVPINLGEKDMAASRLSVDDDDSDEEDESEGYDTDDTPLQSHRVKTKLPHIRNAREQFVYVNDYAKPSDYDSGYDS